MAQYSRKRRTLHLPIWTSVVLMTINITLLVIWIVLLAQRHVLSALTIGSIAFAISVFGISFYLFLTIKEIRLNRRQANFIDSVTHELKTPIASLRLYLDTLRMRELETDRRDEFYAVMERELHRLDRLINQLLEVGRLDAVGHESEPENIELAPLLQRCAESACAHHHVQFDDVFDLHIDPIVVHSRRMLLEMIFGNLLDNAVKYSSPNPRVEVTGHAHDSDRIFIRIRDNGQGVSPEIRSRIFKLFYRGGDELQRKQKGTGIGLYIVRTLVHFLKGRVSVRSRDDGHGSEFVVELPGHVESASVYAQSAN